VVERPGAAPDAAASLEHLPELAERGPVHVRQAALRAQQDVDLDAAHRRDVERGDERAVGHEVGRHDAHRALRLVQAADDRPAQRLAALVRAIVDAAREHGSGGSSGTNQGAPRSASSVLNCQSSANTSASCAITGRL
jgi:hypothetical protein